MMAQEKKKVIVIIVVIKKHAQHEHVAISNKANGSKCMKMLIRHHCVDVQGRKSIWSLPVGCSSLALALWHGCLLNCKKISYLARGWEKST